MGARRRGVLESQQPPLGGADAQGRVEAAGEHLAVADAAHAVDLFNQGEGAGLLLVFDHDLYPHLAQDIEPQTWPSVQWGCCSGCRASGRMIASIFFIASRSAAWITEGAPAAGTGTDLNTDANRFDATADAGHVHPPPVHRLRPGGIKGVVEGIEHGVRGPLLIHKPVKTTGRRADGHHVQTKQ